MNYIAFDIGGWRSTDGLLCPKHGRQDGGLALQATPRQGEAAITRKYCGLCVLEALDGLCAPLGEEPK